MKRNEKERGCEITSSLLLSDYHLIIRSSLLLVRALVIRAVLRSLRTRLRTLLGTGLCGTVHVLGGGVPSLGQFLGVAVDVRKVLILDSLLEGAES